VYNHARTLLINLPGNSGYFDDYPGEELIPEEYLPATLPTFLKTFRSRIFGANPDRAMLNYRTAQLLQIVATTKLQEYVSALDSRITYGDPQALFDNENFLPKIRTIRGNSILTVLGDATSPDATGQTRYEYQINVDQDGLAAVKRLAFPEITEVTQLTQSSNLSQSVVLPYSGYSFVVEFREGFPLAQTQTWNVSGFLRPTTDLNEILNNLKTAGEPAFLQLFGVAPQEPYLTFKNCWELHPDFAYRLSGLVLAIIYRTQEIRSGQGLLVGTS